MGQIQRLIDGRAANDQRHLLVLPSLPWEFHGDSAGKRSAQPLNPPAGKGCARRCGWR
jgi:hypothetical protein